MRFHAFRNAVRGALLAIGLLAPSLALAQSTPSALNVKDAGSNVIVTCAYAQSGKTFPCHVAFGIDSSGNLHAILTDTNGDTLVNVVGAVTIQGGNSIAVKTDDSGVTQPISATALPLPANAAQETGGHLAAIDTATAAAAISAASTATSAAAAKADLDTLVADTPALNGDGGAPAHVTNFPSSFSLTGSLPGFAATPTFNLGTLNGAATAANQATTITDLASLISLSPALNGDGGALAHVTNFPTSFGIAGTLPAFAATPTFNCGTGCSGSGVSAADEAAYTAGTSPFAAGGGFFQTTATSNALTTGHYGAFQTTAQRALFTNLRDSSGNEEGLTGQPLFVQANALPLPTGAATAANQSSMITDLGLLGTDAHLTAFTGANHTDETAIASAITAQGAGALGTDAHLTAFSTANHADLTGAAATTAHGCAIAGYGLLGCDGQIDDDLKAQGTGLLATDAHMSTLISDVALLGTDTHLTAFTSANHTDEAAIAAAITAQGGGALASDTHFQSYVSAEHTDLAQLHTDMTTSPTPGAAAGGYTSVVELALSTTPQLVVAGAHQLVGAKCDAPNSAVTYVPIFDAATAGAVTLGTTTPIDFVPIYQGVPGGWAPQSLVGEQFASGVVVAAVTVGPKGTGAPSTAENCTIEYK